MDNYDMVKKYNLFAMSAVVFPYGFSPIAKR